MTAAGRLLVGCSLLALAACGSKDEPSTRDRVETAMRTGQDAGVWDADMEADLFDEIAGNLTDVCTHPDDIKSRMHLATAVDPVIGSKGSLWVYERVCPEALPDSAAPTSRPLCGFQPDGSFKEC
jgi:hypothetical protein